MAENLYTENASRFSIPAARAIIHDLFEHKQWIYWIDMLVSLAIGYAGASVYLNSPVFSLAGVAGYLVGGFALFRVGSFIHEIVHFRRGQMTAFAVAWDIIAGVPMLMPAFFYENHIDHHNTHHYGTGQDGEYLPLGGGPWQNIVKFFAQVLVLPALVAIRFGVLAPISFLHPALRQWTLERASCFVINFRYRRRSIPNSAPRAYWAFLDALCCLRVWLIFIAVGAGLTPWQRIPMLYAFAMFVLGLNYVRNLVAHHYRSSGESMSHAEQLLDSVNITGGPLTELFFPLNLRYHALHHLFPALPYHNLGVAHQRLMDQLPEDSPYRITVFANYWEVVAHLLENARQWSGKDRDGATEWFERRDKLIESRQGAGKAPSEEAAAA